MKRELRMVIAFILIVIFISSPIFSYKGHASGYFYTVKNGDSLWKIAQKNHTTVYRIKKENNYWSDKIYPGQKLYISVGNNFTKYDKHLIAKTIHAESRGEPFEGQVAVGAVILNRVKSSKFPSTVHGVVYEPYAFTAVIDGQIYLEPNSTAYKAADLAIKGWDPSGGALFYFNPNTATSSWIWSRPQIKKIGNHIFTK